MIERIVVPLDGSLTAEAILPQVRRMLYRNDSEVILVRAVNPPMVENAIVLAEAELAAAREYILGQMERLEKAGVRAKFVVRIGSPVGVILDVVEEHRATLIALATHGATGLKRLLFGSVAEGLIRKSPVPVLLMRPFWSMRSRLRAPEHARADRAPSPTRPLLGGPARRDRARRTLQARVMLLRVVEEKPGSTENRAEAGRAAGAGQGDRSRAWRRSA
jgi:nucleotide-binding universal stress UspA family protein